MTPFRTLSFNALLLLASIACALAQTGPGNCHPYPGTAARDCLELIGQTLNSEAETPCSSTDGRATIISNNCAITTKCVAGQAAMSNDVAVRRALTAIGKCALSDYGSISGYYIGENGDKTCYLYPGK